MSLLQIVISLVVTGAILWAINAFIPMNAVVRRILNIVVVIAAALFLLRAFGILGGGPRILIIR